MFPFVGSCSYPYDIIFKLNIMERRHFLKKTAIAGIGASLAPHIHFARGFGSSDKVRVAVLGTNGRGLAHITAYANIPGVEIAYICDVEEHALDKGLTLATKLTGKTPRSQKDFRLILEDKDIDAVSIATPDHWHTPAAILAIAAGKKVYVEKPCSHNPGEGEMLLSAIRHYDAMVQMGNQRRSWPNINAAMKSIHEGIIGRAYFARGWYTNNRKSIGHGKVVPVPPNLDWNLWQGPAPRKDYRDNLVHYNWHWFWNWGTGESCNNGTHEIDCMRWALEVNYPSKVVSGGGRFAYTDDWQTTDTQTLCFEFPENKAISWEGRSCNNYPVEGSGRGFMIFGEKGTMVNTGDDDFKFYDGENHLISQSKPAPKADTINPLGPGEDLDLYHFHNFIESVRGKEHINSPISEGQKSVLLCQLGNIAQRTASALRCDPQNGGKIMDNPPALALWDREYEAGWAPKA
jgi:predicted dehydrogenase